MTSNNSRLPQRADDAAYVKSTSAAPSTAFVAPVTKTTEPQNDPSFLEDIEKQLLRENVSSPVDARHSIRKATEGQTDYMSQSMILSGPNLPQETPASFKMDGSKGMEVPEVPSTASMSGVTVSIGDLSRSAKHQAKEQAQEQLNAGVNSQAADILSTFDQTQLYRNIMETPDAGTGSDSYRPSISQIAPVVSLTADVPRMRNSQILAEKDADKSTTKENRQVYPSMRVPVEEVITSSEMALTYNAPATDSVVAPQKNLHNSSTYEGSQPRDLTKADPMRNPSVCVDAPLEMRKTSERKTTPIPLSRSSIQEESEQLQPSGNTLAKTPPTSLSFKVNIKYPPDGLKKTDQNEYEDSALPTACQPVRPVLKHETPPKFDSFKQLDEMKANTTQVTHDHEKLSEHKAEKHSMPYCRSSSVPRKTASTLNQKEHSETLDTRGRQITDSSSSMGSRERSSHSSKQPSTLGREASRQKQFMREVEEKLNKSWKKEVQAEKYLRSVPLNRTSASLHAVPDHKASYGLKKLASATPTEQKSETKCTTETKQHISRMTPRRPTSASMAQRPGSRSLSPSKTVRSRPHSSARLAPPNAASNLTGSDSTSHENERTRGTMKHSRNISLTHTRVTAKLVAEEESKNAPPTTGELKSTRSGSRVQRTASLTRNTRIDIFEERASSKGWVSCINASNSVLNQKIPLSPAKSTFHERVDSKAKGTSHRKKTAK